MLRGEWWTDKNEGRVRFTKHSDGTLRGSTTCCAPRKASSDNPTTDIHNPDPKLRGRPTIGIVIIWKLAYADGEYSGGYVYNPRDGKTYRLAVEIIDENTIKVQGGSGRDEGCQGKYDDCWKRSYDTLEEAEAAFFSGSPDYRISHVSLHGPGAHTQRTNAAYDATLIKGRRRASDWHSHACPKRLALGRRSAPPDALT